MSTEKKCCCKDCLENGIHTHSSCGSHERAPHCPICGLYYVPSFGECGRGHTVARMQRYSQEKTEEAIGWESVRLHECKECIAKPGSPVLCVSCQDNRASIEILKDCIRNARTQAKNELTAELRDRIEAVQIDPENEHTPYWQLGGARMKKNILALLPEQESSGTGNTQVTND